MSTINVLTITRVSAEDRAKIEAIDPAIKLTDAGGWFDGEIRDTWPPFARAPKLKWFHQRPAGASNLMKGDLWGSDVLVTTSRGFANALAIAEYAVAGILHFAKGLHHAAIERGTGDFDARAYHPLLRINLCRLALSQSAAPKTWIGFCRTAMSLQFVVSGRPRRRDCSTKPVSLP
jgi:hypothetical protein